MTQQWINARDLIFQVSDMAGSPTWVQVAGIKESSIDLSEHEEMTETTTYDAAGQFMQEKMQVGGKIEIKGLKKQDHLTGVYDVGQALLDTHNVKMGYQSQINIRYRYPVETQWRNRTVTVSRGEEGGGNNDKASMAYSCDFVSAQSLTAAP